MSSHFSRNLYDNINTQQQYSESVGPGNYKLFPGQSSNPNVCFADNGSRCNSSSKSNAQNCTLGSRTSFESELFNITKSGEDNRRDTLGQKNQRTNNLESCGLVRDCEKCLNDCDCGNQQVSYSRLDLPMNNFRGMETSGRKIRPELLLPDRKVQRFWETNLNYCKVTGCNTSLQAKDNYSRTVLNTDKIMEAQNRMN